MSELNWIILILLGKIDVLGYFLLKNIQQENVPISNGRCPNFVGSKMDSVRISLGSNNGGQVEGGGVGTGIPSSREVLNKWPVKIQFIQ